MKYKLFIFDIDGTLADSYPWFVNTINQLSTRHKFRTISSGESEKLRQYSARQILKYLNIPNWKVPIITSELRHKMTQDIEHIKLFKGVDKLLHTLHKSGAQIALVSSNSEVNARHMLGEELSALISHWECGIGLFGKSVRLKQTINRFNLTPHQAIYIGDEVRDIEAANKAQVSFGAVNWGFNHGDILKQHKPTHFFHTIEDIISCV